VENPGKLGFLGRKKRKKRTGSGGRAGRYAERFVTFLALSKGIGFGNAQIFVRFDKNG